MQADSPRDSSPRIHTDSGRYSRMPTKGTGLAINGD